MDRLLPVLEQPLLQKTKGQKKKHINTVANLHDCTKAQKKQTQT